MMMLEDEVALALPPAFDEFEVVESPITCTRWICAGHRNRAEMREVHEAIESCYAAARD